MNQTKIEWVKNPDGTQGYTWNPITGCLNGCSYCFARRLANGRLKQRYLANHYLSPLHLSQNHYKHDEVGKAERDPFYPRFWPERLDDLRTWTPAYMMSSRGIFVCDMGELFGDWVPREWQEKVFEAIKECSQHRFYLLTKQPQNLAKWSPFPSNVHVGVSVTNQSQYDDAIKYLKGIRAKVKFLSIEPLLDWADDSSFVLDWLIHGNIKWLIIGAMTGSLEDIKKMFMEYPQLTPMPWGKKWTLQPKIEWVEEIVKAADKAGIPVFLKDSLLELVNYVDKKTEFAFNKDGYYRQEMPEEWNL